MGLHTLFGFAKLGDGLHPDAKGICILALLVGVHALTKRLRKHAPSPILMILLSAGLGICFYDFPC